MRIRLTAELATVICVAMFCVVITICVFRVTNTDLRKKRLDVQIEEIEELEWELEWELEELRRRETP